MSTSDDAFRRNVESNRVSPSDSFKEVQSFAPPPRSEAPKKKGMSQGVKDFLNWRKKHK